MRTGEYAQKDMRIWIFDLTWLVLPIAFVFAFDVLYRKFAPHITDMDVDLLAYEAVLFVLVVGFTLLARKTFIGGWRLPQKNSWIWVAGPLWLAVFGPLGMAIEAISAAPEKLIVWGAISLFVAVNEETLFRGLMLRGMMRSFKPMTAVIFSSLAFGLLHILNLFEGGDPVTIGAQIISAMGVGAVLAAVTLRSGSIVPGVVLHFLGDVVGLSALGGYGEAIQSTDPALAASLVVTGLVFMIWGLFWSWRAVRADKVIV